MLVFGHRQQWDESNSLGVFRLGVHRRLCKRSRLLGLVADGNLSQWLDPAPILALLSIKPRYKGSLSMSEMVLQVVIGIKQR